MRTLIEVLAAVLVVARLTRLVCADKITEPVRNAIAQRLPVGSAVTYLVFCRWCMSIWIAIPVSAVWCATSPVPGWSGRWFIDVPSAALTLSHATGLLVRAEPED